MDWRGHTPRLLWVKLRRTQSEYMFSALPLNSDIARHSRHVSNVLRTEVVSHAIFTAAASFQILGSN
jgi:hypothetical protein